MWGWLLDGPGGMVTLLGHNLHLSVTRLGLNAFCISFAPHFAAHPFGGPDAQISFLTAPPLGHPNLSPDETSAAFADKTCIVSAGMTHDTCCVSRQDI